MRVALLVPGFSSDERDWCIPALLDYVRSLSRQLDLEVFTLRYPHRRDTYRIGNATVHSLGWAQRRGIHSLTLWVAVYRALVRRHRVSQFDLLHAFWADEPAWIAAACAARLHLPLVVSLAGGELANIPQAQYGLRRHRLQRSLIDRALRSAAIVTAGSSHLLEFACANGINRLSFAPLGVDTNMFTPADSPGMAKRLITVGSLQPVKGHVLLLHAMRLVVDAIPDARLAIIGAGPELAQLAYVIASLQLEQHVELSGAISHELLVKCYHSADLYVQSSWHEAQGMVVLEAAACGLPSVGSNVGTLAELSPDSAVAVSVGDGNALATAIIDMLNDEPRRRAMGQTAQVRAEREYSVQRCVNRFVELYRTALGVD